MAGCMIGERAAQGSLTVILFLMASTDTCSFHGFPTMDVADNIAAEHKANQHKLNRPSALEEPTLLEWVYTDTNGFGGDVNASWQRKGKVCIWNDATSERAIVRRAKYQAGLTGVNCMRIDFGDQILLYPYNSCTVLIVNLSAY